MFGSTSTSVQSSRSAHGFQPYFWRTQNTSKHPSTPQPFGSPFGTQTGSMNTSSGVFGTHHCSSRTIPSSTSFGPSSSPAFGASSPASPVVGFWRFIPVGPTCIPAFGGTGPFGSTTQPLQPAVASSLFGSSMPFGGSSHPAFGATTAPTFGATTAPTFGATTTPFFGATTAPSFGATTAPSFGATTAPSFGATSPFGSITQPSRLFGLSVPFNASTPAFSATCILAFSATGTLAFAATGALAFGATSTPAFGSTAGPTFGSTSASYGVSSSPLFGSSSPLFGSGGAFGTSNNPAFGSSSSTFPTSSNPAFRPSSAPGFGPSNIPSFSFSSQPTFGQSSCTSHFGQSSPFGAQSTSFPNTAFQQSDYWDQQRGGTRVTSYAATPEPDGVNATGKLESISAMPAYKEKGYEELRWEDYQMGDKGGPALGGSGFGLSASEPNPLNHAPSFPQSSTSPFNSTSQSHVFPPKTVSFTSSGFGVSSTPLRSSTIGLSTSTNLFAISSSSSVITSSAPSAISFSATTQTENATFNNGLFNSSAPVAQTCAFGQSTTSFPQNTTPFGQSSLFHAPSTDFGLGSSSTVSSTSNPMSFSQTPPLLNGGLGFKNLTQIQPGTQSATFGSRLVSCVATPEPDGVNTTEKLESISAMPAYKEKSHEELHWEDYYQVRDKAGPPPAGGSGSTLQQSNPLNPALSFPLTSTFSFGGLPTTPFGHANISHRKRFPLEEKRRLRVRIARMHNREKNGRNGRSAFSF